MTLIDHRILVSAPPEVVWELLGDLTAQAKWHTNITQCSLLTTQHIGEGVRYRLHTKRGPDLVCQILSWYNNLGYEYKVIDGPFGENRGRIRLQAIPEGTTVQWTFEYEYRGFGGGLRDRTGVKRRLNNETADSLKQLRRLVESAGIRMDPDARDRVALQPAPSAKERASLSETITRTQPAVVQETSPTELTTSPTPDVPLPDEPLTASAADTIAQPVMDGVASPITEQSPTFITEPPLSDEDTRPNPTIQQQGAPGESPATSTQEQPAQPLAEVINKLTADPADIRLADDYEEPPTEPKRPRALDEAIAQDPLTSEPDETSAIEEPEQDSPLVEEQPPVAAPADALSPTDKTPTPIKDTTPVVLPVVADNEITPQTDVTEPDLEAPIITPDADESVASTRPASPVTVVSELIPPAETESQFTDTIGTVLSEIQTPTELSGDPPADVVEPQPPAPSLLEQDLTPLGPSIWDVFGMDAPGEDEVAPDPTVVEDSPPPAPSPAPTQEASPPDETVDEPAAEAENGDPEHETAQREAKQVRQVIAARSTSKHSGLRKLLGQHQALIRASRRQTQA